MKRLLFGILFLTAVGTAQIVHLNSGGAVRGSQVTINGDFDFLNTVARNPGAYSGGTTYVKGNTVTSSAVVYLSLQDSNAGNTPDLSPSFWAPIATAPLGFTPEPSIAAGTTAQYWRGDKTWQTLNTDAVLEGTQLYFTPARALSAVTWSTITGLPSTFAPSAHASSHQHGGADEIATATAGANAIPKAGSGGKLAQTWIDFTGFQTTAGTFPYSQLTGTPTIPTPSSTNPSMDGTASAGASVDYSRFDHIHPTDTTRQATISGAPGSWPSTFAPSTHATSHQNGGADEVATATPGANAIPKAGSGGTLGNGWLAPACQSPSFVSGGTTTIDWSVSRCAIVTASGGNTTLAFSNPPGGSLPLNLALCNDTSVRTWTFPAAAFQMGAPSVASKCFYQDMIFDGTNYQAKGGSWPGMSLYFSAEAALPATCDSTTNSAGGCAVVDSTTHTFRGRVGATLWGTALVKAATTHQFLTAFDPATGQFTAAQPAAADITGLPAGTIIYKTCVIDNDTQSATALTTAQITGRCAVYEASTVLEIRVWGGTGTGTQTYTGTSSVQVAKRHIGSPGSSTNLLSGVLATPGSTTNDNQACALPAISGTCVNGITSSGTVTVSTTALAAGDEIFIPSATADATQTWYRVAIFWSVN